MAGTNADIATLSNDASFIVSVRAEMIKAAVYHTSAEGLAAAEVLVAKANRARRIIANGGADAERMAKVIAAGNPTIAAASPAVPADGDVAYCIASMFDQI